MMADGAFAVGAIDVYCPPRELDALVKQLGDALQAGLDHIDVHGR